MPARATPLPAVDARLKAWIAGREHPSDRDRVPPGRSSQFRPKNKGGAATARAAAPGSQKKERTEEIAAAWGWPRREMRIRIRRAMARSQSRNARPRTAPDVTNENRLRIAKFPFFKFKSPSCVKPGGAFYFCGGKVGWVEALTAVWVGWYPGVFESWPAPPRLFDFPSRSGSIRWR